MDEFVYNSYDKYFQTLGKLGHVSDSDVEKLLVLNFYYNLMYKDYRGNVSEEDYRLIDQALNCLYGTSCLIPYPEYTSMGSLNIGGIAELAQRVKNLEDTQVVMTISDASDIENASDESDVIIISHDN